MKEIFEDVKSGWLPVEEIPAFVWRAFGWLILPLAMVVLVVLLSGCAVYPVYLVSPTPGMPLVVALPSVTVAPSVTASPSVMVSPSAVPVATAAPVVVVVSPVEPVYLPVEVKTGVPGGYLHLRQTPGGDVLCWMAEGSLIRLLDWDESGWALVEFEGLRGYAWAEYLESGK